MKLHGLTTEQLLSWERDGFMAIEQFLTPEEIRKYDEALDRTLAEWKAKGHAMRPSIDSVKNVIEQGEMYLELMEHPRMMNIMRDLIGDSFVMIDNDLYIKHPGQATHIGWHRDTDVQLIVKGKRIPFMIKVFYFTADVEYEGGCLSFLPGSRHMPDVLLPKVDAPENMPGHVRMNVKAGTAVLFDGGTYHAALDNRSSRQRRSLIYNYGPMFLRTWPGYEPSAGLAEQASTPLRKMLLGTLPWHEDPQVF